MSLNGPWQIPVYITDVSKEETKTLTGADRLRRPWEGTSNQTPFQKMMRFLLFDHCMPTLDILHLFLNIRYGIGEQTSFCLRTVHLYGCK